MSKENLWLPDGYHEGTIIYDMNDEPYEAGNKIMEGVTNIREIQKVSKEYAEARIRQGAQKLISEKK